MLDTASPKGRIIAAALKLAAERPWKDVRLIDIAAATDGDVIREQLQWNDR